MSDLDRVFESAYRAVDLFTDRLSESEIFAESLQRHLQRMSDADTVLGRPSRNVLTFYGMGGIGKTELSCRLQRWIGRELAENDHWGSPPWFDQPIKTVRFDFHGSPAVDAIDIVLRLRGAAAARLRRFPAFDLGLAAWWAAANPGTPLPDIRTDTGLDVKGQVADTLNDIISGAGAQFGLGGFTVRTADAISRAILTHHRHRKALEECPPLEAIIKAAGRDPSPYVAAMLAGLLSWDLEKLHIAESPVIVAFADTLEYVLGGNRVQERLISRIVSLTPRVLWVVTTRDRLDWDSPHLSAVLPASGPSAWPGLTLTARTEPRQHLVGDLSDTDVVRYLHAASGRTGNPVLPDDVIEAIRRGAHGLPLYLDLSLERARHAQSALVPADFGGSLPNLVLQVFATLRPEEHDLARTASLLPRFDSRLLALATGRPVGEAERFCHRSLVMNDGHAPFPCRLHDAVRAAVTAESAESDNAWAPEDRNARAASLLEALNTRYMGVGRDVSLQASVLELAAGLCAAYGLSAKWLYAALLQLPSMTQAAALLPPPSDANWMGQVSALFEGWRNRSNRERIDYLRSLLKVPLPADIYWDARVRLGYAYNSAGQFDAAVAVFQELLAEKPESDICRYHVARNLHSLARYNDIERHLSEYPIKNNSMAARFQSDLAFDRAEMSEAIDGAAYRARVMREAGNDRVELDNRQVALWRSAVAGRASLDECDLVISEGDQSGRRLTMRMALAAKALCLRHDQSAGQEIMTEMTALDNGSASWLDFFVGLVHALRWDDQDQLIKIRNRWTDTARPWTPNRQVVDRVFVFAGYPSTYPGVQMGNVTGSATLESRWNAIIAALVSS